MLATGLVEFVGALAGGGIGGALMVTGLSRWLGEVWLGRILAKEKAKYDQQLERLRAQIDRSVFVTRAHFETEFDAYKRVFEDLAEVRLLMPGMHPLLDITYEGETKEDRSKQLAENLNTLIAAHNKCVRTVENLGPFYPKEIFEKLSKCLQVVRIERIHVQTGGSRTFSSEWAEQGERHVEDFIAAYQAASEAVRQRIATLAILPQ